MHTLNNNQYNATSVQAGTGLLCVVLFLLDVVLLLLVHGHMSEHIY
jgi:hypothetical protein